MYNFSRNGDKTVIEFADCANSFVQVLPVDLDDLTKAVKELWSTPHAIETTAGEIQIVKQTTSIELRHLSCRVNIPWQYLAALVL